MFIGKVICLLQTAKAWQRINTYVIETNNKRRNALHDFWDSWVRYISSQITYLIRENSLLKVNSKMLLQKMIYLFLNFKGQIILLLNLPFFSLVVSKMELGPTKPIAENDLIFNIKGQIILLLNLPIFSLVVSKMELRPTKPG